MIKLGANDVILKPVPVNTLIRLRQLCGSFQSLERQKARLHERPAACSPVACSLQLVAQQRCSS